MPIYFITGGAGFLGINLTRYLLDKGHTVVSYDFAEKYDYPEKDLDSVIVVQGDIRNKEQLAKSMKGNDIVIHCAAALPLYTKEDIFTTDVDGTRNLLEAAKQNGIPGHHPLVEKDKLVVVGLMVKLYHIAVYSSK